MRVLLSGSSGLIGRAVLARLRQEGATVVPLVRGLARPGTVAWDPERGELDPATVTGFDAVVHLAGEPVGSGRWTEEKKRKIHNSRVQGTALLAGALRRAVQPPKVFVSASGINYYGDRGAEVLDEGEPRGKGFLADVCERWEAAADPLRGVARVSALRIGAVLTPRGGMLAEVLPQFRLGLGGPIGGGGRYVSWVTLPDLVSATMHVLRSEAIEGAVNAVSPEPVTNAVFTRTLAAALGRPAIVPVPAWAVRMVFGQFGEATALSSVRAVPARLVADGFVFKDAALGPALARVLPAS